MGQECYPGECHHLSRPVSERPISVFTRPKKSRCCITVRWMKSMLCCGHSPSSSRASCRCVAMFQPPTSAWPPLGA